MASYTLTSQRSHTGVDIDAAEPHAMETSGPNSDLNLCFSKSGLTATHSALLSYYGKESNAQVGYTSFLGADTHADGITEAHHATTPAPLPPPVSSGAARFVRDPAEFTPHRPALSLLNGGKGAQ